MEYYKFLTKHGQGTHSGFDYKPYFPEGDEPGPWLPAVDVLEECKSGYHAFRIGDLLYWCDAVLWEIEYREQPEEYYNKVNGRQIRFVRRIDTWNGRTALLFAVWCAREALRLVDNPDPRSIEACNVAERYANGSATKNELAAASYAARAAASDAARTAASAAASAAAVASDASDAAWTSAAARAAARAAAAARTAAAAAASDAAWDKQINKLIEMLDI